MICCPNCGKENADDCQTCYHCLQPLKKSARKDPAPKTAAKGPAAACPACGADNDPDAAFCDQCGLSMSQEPEAPGCPECGGKVEEIEGGRGVCTRCGVELAQNSSPEPEQKPEEPPRKESVEPKSVGAVAPIAPELSQRLSRMILEKVDAGMALEPAVETSCRECLGVAAEAAPKEEEKLTACPVCGKGNSPEAPLCAECGISFRPAWDTIVCPRCTKPCSSDTCSCGAIMTLSKLLSYVDDSVLKVCPRCKNLLTKPAKECPTCACDVLPAERLKAYAAEHQEQSAA